MLTCRTWENSEAWREYLIAAQGSRMADLANWMAATGGPVDAMDGSRQSLVPLWEWFLEFRDNGFPGVAADQVSDDHVAVTGPGSVPLTQRPTDDDPSLRTWGRPGYVAEAMEHYVAAAIAHAHPELRWKTLVNPRDGHNLFVGIQIGRQWDEWEGVISRVLGQIRGNRFGRAEPTGLADLMRWRPVEDLPPGPSLLRPLVGSAPVRPPIPVFTWVERDEAEGAGFERVGEDLFVTAKAGRAAWDVDRLPPLPEDATLAMLTELGVEDAAVDEAGIDEGDELDGGGRPVTAELLSGDEQFYVLERTVLVGTYGFEGRLRAMSFEPIEPSEVQWKLLRRLLRRYGRDVGARIAREM